MTIENVICYTDFKNIFYLLIARASIIKIIAQKNEYSTQQSKPRSGKTSPQRGFLYIQTKNLNQKRSITHEPTKPNRAADRHAESLCHHKRKRRPQTVGVAAPALQTAHERGQTLMLRRQ